MLNGTKRWCSGGGHSDAYLVYCRLSETPGAKGIGAVYVEGDTPGLTFGEQEQLMGFRGVPESDLYFDEVLVPADHLVVPAGGFPKLMRAFDLERCGNASMALGQAAAALDDALAWVQERRQFGKPIVEFQAVQLKLAEMAIQVEAARRLLIYRAAQNAEGGLPSVLDSSIAKVVSNEAAREVTGMGVQLMGGYGYSRAVSDGAAHARRLGLGYRGRHHRHPEGEHRVSAGWAPVQPASLGVPARRPPGLRCSSCLDGATPRSPHGRSRGPPSPAPRPWDAHCRAPLHETAPSAVRHTGSGVARKTTGRAPRSENQPC